jgi:hypothetical protein
MRYNSCEKTFLDRLDDMNNRIYQFQSMFSEKRPKYIKKRIDNNDEKE